MRKLIDKDDLSIIELDNDWGHSVYCVLEQDVEDAPEVEAIEIDWIIEYVEENFSDEPALMYAFKEMVGTWYDEWYEERNFKRRKPTLSDAYRKGYRNGSKEVKKEFIGALKSIREELIKKRGENGEQTETGDNPTVQE